MKNAGRPLPHVVRVRADCNAQSLAMLESVPADRRSTPEFQKAVGRMAHLVAARRRLATGSATGGRPAPVPQLHAPRRPAGQVADTERAWVAYLARIDDRDLARELEWVAGRPPVPVDLEGILTQTFGHAWYHRGQIAQLVAALGGKAVDTDYIFWCNLTQLDGGGS